MNTCKALPLQSKNEKARFSIPVLIMICGSFIALLSFPDETRNTVNLSLINCVTLIIPSIFPFAVLGEIFFSCGYAELIGAVIGKPFRRIFGISENGVSVFLLGAVCGLPLGGKYALTLYSSGAVSKDECERLMGISSNAGLGFVVAGVGSGIWGDTLFGWIIYISQILSASIVGAILFRPKTPHYIAPTIPKTAKKPFLSALTEAIPTSAFNMLKICSFTVFFGIISTFIRSACEFFTLHPFFELVLCTLTEISYACTSLHVFSIRGSIEIAKTLTFFAVAFSGFCVHAQLSSMTSDTDIGMKKYYCIRLVCAILCAVIGTVIMKLIPLFSQYTVFGIK